VCGLGGREGLLVGRWGVSGWVSVGWVGRRVPLLFIFILFYFCLFLHFACNSLVSVQFCSYFVCLFVYIKYLGSVYIINLMCFCINLM